MRRFALFALALTLGAAACDSDSPNSPTSGPVVFTAEMSAANEVTATGAPAPTGAESNARGTVTITFTVPRDGSGNPTGDGVWNVQALVGGLTATSVIRLAHIHNGPAGVNAGIFVNTGLTAANEIPVPTDTTINFTDVAITQAQAAAVMANPAGHYFNMHSALNPGGVVRGQLVRVR
jgi:CHRD domain